MTGWREALAASAALVAVGVVAAPAQAAGDGRVPYSRLFSFRGEDVVESSGLVDRGDIVYTNNDSGDDAVIYGVDPRSGRVVSRTTYAGSASDVEAIAPGAGGTIWAGDTGDNRTNRDDVQVYRVVPRDGHHRGTRYDLAYPDGSHDAETLLVQPRTQRVFVVSKTVFGGTVYAAPRQLRTDRTNRLRAFASVGGLLTDGTFFPDGRHVLLRTYSTATVYTFPGFRPVGTVRLPPQPQGEGISVSSTGRVLVSSEGVHADVLRIRLPARLTSPDAPVSTEGPAPVAAAPDRTDARPRSSRDWVGIGAVALGIVGAVYLVLRASPRHGRRRP